MITAPDDRLHSPHSGPVTRRGFVMPGGLVSDTQHAPIPPDANLPDPDGQPADVAPIVEVQH